MSNLSFLTNSKFEHYPLQNRAVLTFPNIPQLEAFFDRYESWLPKLARSQK